MPMSYLTKEEFSNRLLTEKHETLVEKVIFSGVPFVFRDNPEHYDLLIRHISDGLDIPTDHITLVGSGRTGFSLDPEKFGVPFSEVSDLDILVVSESWFDGIWLDFLQWNRRTHFILTPSQKRLIDKNRVEIYWGRLWPDDLAGITSWASPWFGTFKSVSRLPSLARWSVSGRLFRTWDHAKLYQLWTMAVIARRLAPS